MNIPITSTEMIAGDEQDAPPEVLGFSLNIAIETLSEIHKLGKAFVQDLGIESIQPTFFYPYQYRLSFFQEIYSRFGWPGLFMLGAKIPEHVSQVLAKKGTPSTYLLVIQPYADQLKELILLCWTEVGGKLPSKNIHNRIAIKLTNEPRIDHF